MHHHPQRLRSQSPCTEVSRPPSPKILQNQERKGHINSRERDKQGSTGRCPRDFLLFVYHRKTDRKGHFSRDTSRVSLGHPAMQGAFRNLCDFCFCALSAPYKSLKAVLLGLPAWSIEKASEKTMNTDVDALSALVRVLGGSVETYLTLRAGRPGKTFSRLSLEEGKRTHTPRQESASGLY